MEKLMSDHGHFSSYEGHKERRTGKIRGAFSRMHGSLDGWMLARALLRIKGVNLEVSNGKADV